MAPAQTNLTNNFNAFISQFISKGYDYHIGVTTTDTWKANFGWGAGVARLKDGVGATHSGVYVITPSTPNIQATFLTNAKQGIVGSGDERAFQSFQTALSSSLNSDFRRADAFLAIIIISDEDDFSWNGGGDNGKNYSDPNLYSISYYVNYLNTLTNSTASLKKYSVSSINVLDNACLTVSDPSASIGLRYAQLVTATSGIQGSLCAPNFSTELDKIQEGILTLASQFYLPRIPVEATIQVIVDNSVIPKGATNGWTYDAAANSIVFHGSALPAQGSVIIVNYDPITIL